MSTGPMESPGDLIQRLLCQRGWTQDDLSAITGRPRQAINEIISGRRGVTPDMANVLAVALGVPAAEWIRMDSMQKLASMGEPEARAIRLRARCRDLAPLKEMIRRQWIRPTSDDASMAQELCNFFGITSVEQEPSISVSARATANPRELNPAQRAWCFRTRQLGGTIQAPPYEPARAEALLAAMRTLAAYPSEARHIPKTLAEFGVRFLVNEQLPNSKIDGAAMWLDEESPIIAVSLRYDRIDAFWFTVMHELSHVIHQDASLDCNLVGEGQELTVMKDDIERRADDDAAASLVSPKEIESFILRVSPLYSKTRIVQFAHRIHIHPGIVVGQLQHRGEIGYSANREMLVKIREVVTETAITDGWGHAVSKAPT